MTKQVTSEKENQMNIDQMLQEALNENSALVTLTMTNADLRALRAVVTDYKTGNSRMKAHNRTTAWLAIRPSKENGGQS